MKKIFFLIFIVFILSFVNLIFAQQNSSLQGPPDTINLKMGEPRNFNDALKRIADFAILNTILPPVINREKLQKQLYGKYYQKVNEYILKNHIDLNKLSSHVQTLLAKKNLSLEDLKKELYKEIFKNQTNILSPRNIYITGIIIGLLIIFGIIFFTKRRNKTST